MVPFSSLQMDGPAGYTNCAYWDTMARDYDGEIMSSFDEDVKKVIKRRVDDHCRGAAAANALDLGCGVGKYLPLLAARCGRVLGVDISAALLEQAGRLCGPKLCAPSGNVTLRCVDLANYRTDAHVAGDLYVACLSCSLSLSLVLLSFCFVPFFFVFCCNDGRMDGRLASLFVSS